MQTLDAIQRRLGYRFRRVRLLEQALSHPSAVPNSPFERYEFLGDAVLDAVVAILLFKRHPDRNEAYLTNLKSAYVTRSMLEAVAARLRLTETCVCGQTTSVRPDDLLEAVIGAIFLDGGWKHAGAFICRHILSRRARPLVDHKTLLYTAARRRYGTDPQYTVARVTGPHHIRTFHVEARIPGLRRVGRGADSTRKAAELRAARDLLRKLPSRSGGRNRGTKKTVL